MSTYVLVHGAWHTGKELEPTAAPIRAAGHQVHTPTLAGNRPGDSKKTGLDEAIKSFIDYLTWMAGTNPATTATYVVLAHGGQRAKL